VHSDAIAICVLVGRRDDRSHRNILEFADSLESVTNLSPLNGKLMFVANVLVSASPTPAEIRTLRFHTIRRALLHFDQFRSCKLLSISRLLPKPLMAIPGTLEIARNCIMRSMPLPSGRAISLMSRSNLLRVAASRAERTL